MITATRVVQESVMGSIINVVRKRLVHLLHSLFGFIKILIVY